jgi:hypothetical protein
LALGFGADQPLEICFQFTPAQVQTILGYYDSLPQDLKGALDVISVLLSLGTGGKFRDFMQSALEGVHTCVNPIFQVTGSCADYSSIKIEWFNTNFKPLNLGYVTITPTAVPLDPADEACPCTANEDPPKGKRRVRSFYVSWDVAIELKARSGSFQAQSDRIRVSAPCCCGDKQVLIAVASEPTPQPREVVARRPAASPRGRGRRRARG